MLDPELALADPLLQKGAVRNVRCSGKVLTLLYLLIGSGLLVLLTTDSHGEEDQEPSMTMAVTLQAPRTAGGAWPVRGWVRNWCSGWRGIDTQTRTAAAWVNVLPMRGWCTAASQTGGRVGMRAMAGADYIYPAGSLAGAAVEAREGPGEAVEAGEGPVQMPLSLNVHVRGGILERVLNRSTELPARSRHTFTTTVPDQDTANIYLFVGERPFSNTGLLLSVLTLRGLPTPSHAGFVRIGLDIEVTDTYQVHVEASDLDSPYFEGPVKCNWTGQLLNVYDSNITQFYMSKGKMMETTEIAPFDSKSWDQTPHLRPFRIVPVGSHEVLIRQMTGAPGAGKTGGALWSSAEALARLVGEGGLEGLGLNSKVLELGAGLGLPTMVCASRGAHVLATDTDNSALELLGNNVYFNVNVTERLPLLGDVSADILDWTSWTDRWRVATVGPVQGPWDFIIGSELLNGADFPLLETIEFMAGQLAFKFNESGTPHSTQVILAQRRDKGGEVERFLVLLKAKRWKYSLSMIGKDVNLIQFRLPNQGEEA